MKLEWTKLSKTGDSTIDYHAFIVERRETLRQSYARFMQCGSKLRQKGLVHWSLEHHCYYAESINDRSHKERRTIQMLLALQRNIKEQAMLLLELQHAMDCEEAKENK
jgi:hypothetical protein